jgi:hypothetical protein
MIRHTGEHFIDAERATIASAFTLQSPSINGSELDTPETDRFMTDRDASFG